MNKVDGFNFPHKVFLSGADCFYLMLDKKAKKNAIGNNVIRVAFFFENKNSAFEFLNNASQSPIIHWMCNNTLVQPKFFKKAYWLYSNAGNKIKINETTTTNNKSIPSEILNRNIPLRNKCLIELDLIQTSDNSTTVVLSWHHILMDGRGSHLLIEHLNNKNDLNEQSLLNFFPEKEKKYLIFKPLINMMRVKRFIEASSKAPLASLSKNNLVSNKNFILKTICFTANETELLDSNSKKNNALLGANNFLIACCAHVVNLICKQRNVIETLWVPVPYDGRKRGSNGPVITNCINFMFFRLPQTELTSIEKTVESLNAQMKIQIKNETPQKYNLLLNTMRHLPLSLYSFLTTRSSKGVVASFLFSSSGEGFRDLSSLKLEQVNDILIVPPFAYPPGLLFSFMRYNNQLKMNIAYAENTMDEKEFELIEKKIKELFFEN